MRCRWLLVLLAASACANLDGLAGGSTDASTDAGVDATLPDASPTLPVDASDAAVEPDAPQRPSFCDAYANADNVLLCSSFDTVDGLVAGFTSTTQDPSATVLAQDGGVLFTSPSEGADCVFQKVFDFGGSAPSERVTASAVISVPSDKAGFTPLGLFLFSGNNPYEVALRVEPGNLVLREVLKAIVSETAIAHSPPRGERWELRVKRVINDSKFRIELLVDGVALLERLGAFDTTSPVAQSSLRLGVYNSKSAARVFFDDALLTSEK